MQDRTPTEALANGAVRYGIYDENGTFLRYEYIKPEDNPTQEGTPLNKENLLSDVTAALYGLDADAVPDDLLAMFKNYFAKENHASSATTYGKGDYSNHGHLKLSSSVASTYDTSNGVAATPSAVKAAYDKAVSAYNLANGRAKIATGSYTGTGTSGSGNPKVINTGFRPKFGIIVDRGYPYRFGVFVYGSNQATTAPLYTSAKVTVSWNSNNMSFYGSDAGTQLNMTRPYDYVFFG